MAASQLYFLSLAVLALGGGGCYLLSARSKKSAGALAALCSLVALVLAAVLVRVEASGFTYAVYRLPGHLQVDLIFQVKPFTAFLNLMVCLFGFCVVLHSLSYWAGKPGSARFYAYCLWAVVGASVALLTRNMLVFVFAWELVTVMLYLLIGLGGPKARSGAAKSFAILGFSDLAMFLAVGLLFVRSGASLKGFSVDYLQGPGRIVVANWGDVGIYLLLLAAALAKAGAIPLHTWIPAAADGAPMPTMALLPAALDKLLGIVLLARISLGFFVLTPRLRMLLMVIGAVTVMGAVMMAMVQHNLRRLLSFHAVSQVGYMVLGIGTGVAVGIVGGLFHMINHAIYKSLLFLSGGAVESKTGDLELDNLGGLARTMPLTATAFFIGAMAISGVPPLNGFVSKWMVYQGVITGGGSGMPLLLAAAVLGSALTLASFVKAMHSVFFGEPSPALTGKDVREVNWNMLFPLGLLSGLCVLFGLFGGYVARFLVGAGLLEEFGWGEPVALQAAAELSSRLGFWGPLQAVVLMIAGLALGMIFYWIGRATRIRRVRPFLGGEVDVPAPTHMSGTQFYQTVRELPGIGGVYSDAEKEAFDVYRLSGGLGATLVRALRKLHTGVLEVYVTWVVVGVAAIIALLFLMR